MSSNKLVVIVCLITIVANLVINHRVEIVSQNVDNIHKDMYGVGSALDSKIKQNLDVANGDIGYLIDENLKLKAMVTGLSAKLDKLTMLSQFQDQFIHDAIQAEMGKRDFEKFKKKWSEAKTKK